MDEIQLQLMRRLMKLETMIEDIYDSVILEKKQCPICKSKIRLYTPFGDPLRSNAKCPVCQSLERHRALYISLEREYGALEGLKGLSILHFAPEKVYFDLFSANKNIDYYPVDFDPGFPGIRDVVDITQIPYENDQFDLIICSHVIEHITEEQQALKELKRVLKSEGLAYINAPIYNELEFTLEKEEYNTPELRYKFYGQHDHVRKYGRDYTSRIKQSGFNVDEVKLSLEFNEKQMMFHGLAESEILYKCTK